MVVRDCALKTSMCIGKMVVCRCWNVMASVDGEHENHAK